MFKMTDQEKIEELRTHLLQNKAIRQPLARTEKQFDKLDLQIQNLKEAQEPSPLGNTRHPTRYDEKVEKREKQKKQLSKEAPI